MSFIKTGVIGQPVAHSKSPLFTATGLKNTVLRARMRRLKFRLKIWKAVSGSL